jgi:hypothetical protein
MTDVYFSSLSSADIQELQEKRKKQRNQDGSGRGFATAIDLKSGTIINYDQLSYDAIEKPNCMGPFDDNNIVYVRSAGGGSARYSVGEDGPSIWQLSLEQVARVVAICAKANLRPPMFEQGERPTSWKYLQAGARALPTAQPSA